MMPASLLGKSLVVLAIVLALAGAVIGVIRAVDGIYDAGYAAGESEAKATQLQALVDAQNAVIELNRELAQKGIEIARLEAEALLDVDAAPRTVERIIRENPQFAARRPDALVAERVRSLQAIADATAGRSHGGVPAGGVRAVPGPADRP